jgi:hypothetical protein
VKEIETFEERVRELAKTETLAKGYSADPFLLAHIERLKLIYAPFPVVRRVGTGSALPWGGTIVGDTFYGADALGGRRRGGTTGTEGDYEYDNFRNDADALMEALEEDD